MLKIKGKGLVSIRNVLMLLILIAIYAAIVVVNVVVVFTAASCSTSVHQLVSFCFSDLQA